MHWRIPEVIEGQGAIIKLPEILSEKHGLKRPLLMISKTVERSGLLDRIFIDMKEKGIEYAIYDDVAPNPTEINVEEGLKIYLNNKCDSLIAIGGGSAIDCCKVVGARVVNPDKTVAQMMGMKVRKKIPLMIALPTTSGTGSETTMYAVINDSKTHHKAGIGDLAILPDYAVLDPELMVGLPPYLMAIRGMDALCHADECYTNYKFLTDLEKEHAKKAVKLIYENLFEAYKDGKNLERRLNMQKAAFDAGVAFNRGMTGYVHGIGHTLSGLYDVPHGLAMECKPSIILTLADDDFYSGRENSIISLSYLELYAPSLQLGSCWAGIFEACDCSENSPIHKLFNILEKKKITGTVMVGYPKYSFKRLTDRQPLSFNFLYCKNLYTCHPRF